VGRNNNQTGRGHRRWIVLLGVAGVHLLALWLVELTLKFRAGQTSDAPAMLWMQISRAAAGDTAGFNGPDRRRRSGGAGGA
jgi:hypothetical protein